MTDADTRNIRHVLFEAVESSEAINPLVDLFLYQTPTLFDGTARAQRESLLTTAAGLNKSSARRFFDGIRRVLKRIVADELFVPESAYFADVADNDQDQCQQVISDAQSSLALNFLKVSAYCMESYINSLVERRGDNSSKKIISVIEEVFQVMQMLHDSLISLQACDDDGLKVQTKICILCETWWKNNFQDRECMVIQLLPLLLAKSLDETATKADINRVWGIRLALEVLDLEDESSSDIKSLMARTVSSPLYIKTLEGKKLISYLFELIPTQIHHAMRVQMPDAKKTTLEAYGEIYFRVWKESPVPDAFEESILQELCYAALHVGNPTMAKSLHIILEPFHKGQASQPVKELLHRLYGPILWRSLRAANPFVRANAASILGVVFPLVDGVNVEKAIHKGILALKHLLKDSDPRVRVVASEVTATVLRNLWDALSSTDIRALLNHIVGEHASDASSSAVRVGAVTAVSILLDAEQSHAVLRALLPALGNLIHDKVERVRLAIVRLLTKIKTIPGIKYYHVVPVHHLLARLVAEGRPPKSLCNPVASALTNLMLNSYFPQNVPSSAQVNRTVKFLDSDPSAAAAFYANLSAHLPVNSVSKLAAMLLRCLVLAVESNQKSCSEKRKRKKYGTHQPQNDEDDENKGEFDDFISSENTSLMASIAETICCLWESIETDLRSNENEPCLHFLVNAFSGAVLANVNSHFEEKAHTCDETTNGGVKIVEDCHRVCAAILRCAGRLSPESVMGLAHQVVSKLDSIDNERDMSRENVTPHVALLCLWGMTEAVSESLAMSISVTFDYDKAIFDDMSRGKKRRSRRARDSTPNLKAPLGVPQLSSHVAMEVLESILRGSDPSSVAARQAILSSRGASTTLEQALEKGQELAERLLKCDSTFVEQISESNVELILRLCETSGRFALHKEALQNASVTLSAQARTLLQWTTDRVVPALTGNSERVSPSPFRDLDLSRISIITDTPGSPEHLPSQKKRTDRKKTPQKFDGSFRTNIVPTDSNFAEITRNRVLARGTAISLLQSSCIVFSEWIAVGGSGANEIAQSAVLWCDIFLNAEKMFQTELVPSFLRLAVQLCTFTRNFSVLGRLIVTCQVHDESEEAALVKKTVSTLLNGRDHTGTSLLDGMLEEILIAVRWIIYQDQNVSVNVLCEAPSSWKDVLQCDRGCMSVVLVAVGSSKKACATFAEKLLVALTTGPDENVGNAMVFFLLRSLWLLCETGLDSGTIDQIVRKLSNSTIPKTGDIHDAVKNFIGYYS